MSNIYIKEPPTSGKVLLITTVGDIDVELWSKEAPKACRNFIQLCMEGYYEGTLFHRVVRDFIAQGGDPTGTGHGGESIYGKPFKDEFHSRLRFNRRGMVAMANAGPHDNGSQFFFTLGPADELDRKHTLFGKVTGNTVFNMLRLGDCETDSNERPHHPHKIIRAKVLSSPFDDIVPRRIHKEKTDKKKEKSQSKATKNFSLLSFGEEAEEEEEEANIAAQTFKSKSKSSHDLLDDSHLSSLPAVEQSEDNKKRVHSEERLDDDVDSEQERSDDGDKEQVREHIRKKLKKETAQPPVPAAAEEEVAEDDEEQDEKSAKMEELRKEAKRLKKELLASKKKEEGGEGSKEPADEDEEKVSDNSVVAAYKAERRKFKEKRKEQHKKVSSRETDTLALLAKFQTKITTAKQLAEYGEEEEEEEEGEAKSKGEKPAATEGGKEEGEADESDSEEEDDPTDLSWMGHTLHFDESRQRRVIDANVDDNDRFEIYDPRNPMTKRRREASKQTMKNKR